MKVGDIVETIDDHLKGTVVSIVDKNVTIRSVDGFDLYFNKHELIVLPESGMNEHNYVPGHIFKEKQSGSKKRKSSSTALNKASRKEQPAMEVDLHIEQLTPSTKGMTNHDMRTLQLDVAKRQLDFAIVRRVPRIVFIHGVGDGILRADLESLLRRYDDRLTYYDADYKKYGRGATEVRFFQNPKG